jgi:hypothetical protein
LNQTFFECTLLYHQPILLLEKLTMSLPVKQEILDKAQTLSFPERVKFGAKLGHSQTKNAGLSTFLKDIRSVRVKI